MDEEPSTLQARLNRAIDIFNGKRRRKVTDREIGDAVGCAHTVIFNLRHGVRSDTQSHLLSRIEDYLGAPPGYLTKWSTSQNPAALQVAMRVLECSPEGVEAVKDFLAHIERLEAKARTSTPTSPPSE